MVRVGKDNVEGAASLPGGEPMEMGGRRMRGFFFVTEEACDDDTMKQWLSLALSFVTTLPAK